MKTPAHLAHKTAKKGCGLLSCGTEAFIEKVFGYFSVSSKYPEGLNEILDFEEMEGDRLRKHVYKMTIIVASHRKDVNMLTCPKNPIFKVWEKKNVLLQFGNTLRMKMEKRIIVQQKFICCFSRTAC